MLTLQHENRALLQRRKVEDMRRTEYLTRACFLLVIPGILPAQHPKIHNLLVQLFLHSITVAVEVVLLEELSVTSSISSVFSLSSTVSLLVDTWPLAKGDLKLALAPKETIDFSATLMPAWVAVLWKAAALSTLVDCHTFASKFSTAPVLIVASVQQAGETTNAGFGFASRC